jgi:hypothetical protein
MVSVFIGVIRTIGIMTQSGRVVELTGGGKEGDVPTHRAAAFRRAL